MPTLIFFFSSCGASVSVEAPPLLLVRTSVLLSRCTEKLEGEKLNVAEVTQSEIAQKQKLQTVLERINDSLKLSTRSIRWNVDCEDHFSPILFSLFYFSLHLSLDQPLLFSNALSRPHKANVQSRSTLLFCLLWRDGRHLCIGQSLH